MTFRAAIALFALAVPAFAQHGGGHGGSFGGSGSFGGRGPTGRGFSGNPGLSRPSGPGFSAPGNFVRPAPSAPPGAYRNPGSRSLTPPNYPIRPGSAYGNRFVYGSRFAAPRPEYSSMGAGSSRVWNQDGSRGRNRGWSRDRFDARRRQFANWYFNTYPAWYGYPYLFDPGFYDSDDFYDSGYDQSGPPPDYSAPYPPQDYDPQGYGPQDYGQPAESPEQEPPAHMQVWNAPNAPAGYGAPAESPQQGSPGGIPVWNAPNLTEPSLQRAPSGPIPLPMPEAGHPLTVIFKGGRTPMKMQNYLITAETLTDLDEQHHEEIPLNQIDFAATQQANSAAGVDFQVPGRSRD